jgi:hypothetical protein
MTFFYPFRFLSLYGGHWPLPDYQTFHYPGIPSVLVPYDQTNDFYFSGHTGLCTVLLFMFILHYNDNEDYSNKEVKDSESVVTQTTDTELVSGEISQEDEQQMTLGHKLAIAYGAFTLILTLYMLTITRGHYFNDLLIGFVVALTGIYYANIYRYTIFYYIIWGYARLFDILICTRYTSKGDKSEELISEGTKQTKIENL